MDITLIVKDNCQACLRVELVLKSLAERKKEIILTVVNIKDLSNPKAVICPALFVNQELYSYGDINEEKLLIFINQQYKKGACSRGLYQTN
ncbi:hypothetical protein [Ignavibacterium sp.]|uniref:hypothetical protein n=1 Tax=Ignavibacterium sp. TaxID=2651167 RepID=UPI00307FBC9C